MKLSEESWKRYFYILKILKNVHNKELADLENTNKVSREVQMMDGTE